MHGVERTHSRDRSVYRVGFKRNMIPAVEYPLLLKAFWLP